MKRYELEDLDMTEVGSTDCQECPLYDNDLKECSSVCGGINASLWYKVACMSHIVKLKAKKAKSLGRYYKQLSLVTGMLALGFMFKLFVTMQQTPVEGALQLLLMVCSTLSLIVSFFGNKLETICK